MKEISKFICPSWQRFECLSLKSHACPAADSTDRTYFHTALRLKNHSVSRAHHDSRVSRTASHSVSRNRCPRILFASPFAHKCFSGCVLPWQRVRQRWSDAQREREMMMSGGDWNCMTGHCRTGLAGVDNVGPRTGVIWLVIDVVDQQASRMKK